MRNEHRDVQKWIKRQYGARYTVDAEVDQQNYLPDRKRHWYQPDVLLRNKKNGEVVYIIEVESDPVRKALVGAVILADYSVKALKQKSKPRLIFIVYDSEGIRQIQNFKDKLKIADKYIANLAKVDIYSYNELKHKRL